MKLIVVPHGKKLEGIGAYCRELAADPPMTMEGKQQILNLVPQLKTFGPYDAAYSSLMDRACGSMCTAAKQLGIERATCLKQLGQHSNKDGDGTIIFYPGCENDNTLLWQQQGIEAVRLINLEVAQNGLAEPIGGKKKKVLVFTHRPILAGLVAAASYITDAEGIQQILDAKELVGKGFRVFNCTNSGLTLEV